MKGELNRELPTLHEASVKLGLKTKIIKHEEKNIRLADKNLKGKAPANNDPVPNFTFCIFSSSVCLEREMT